jgi:urease accessory protein
MLTIQKLIPRGQGLATVLLKRAARVELDWDVRQKSRFDATDTQGRHLGVFLPRGTVVRGGDVLLAEDGSLVVVQSAPQTLLEVSTCPDHGQPFDLLRAAYHLGNRHVTLALQPERLLLEPDHVLADMLRQMHLIVREVQAPFEPEGGAYVAGGSSHGHGHGHDHGHSSHTHAHAAPAAEAHAAAPAPARGKPIGIAVTAAPAATPHVHGPGCGHDHGHHH